MKNGFLLVLQLYFLIACNAQTETGQGFTNKAEAKNQMVNGIKEGKWVEYITSGVVGDTVPTMYKLIIYTAGKPGGIVRVYSINGRLEIIEHFVNGVEEGISQMFDENGKVSEEIPFTSGKINGAWKRYYKNGKLQSETTYINGIRGETKRYDEIGKEIK